MLVQGVKAGRSLTIAGSATVAEASTIRDQLAAAVAEGGDVDIVFEASEFDVTAFQLLVSAQRSLRERGGSIHLAHPPAGALLSALTESGFIHAGAANAIWTARASL